MTTAVAQGMSDSRRVRASGTTTVPGRIRMIATEDSRGPRFSLLPFLFGFVLQAVSFAAPLTHDLGQGLRYHRAHELPADLPATTTAPQGALVLDLRYAGGNAEAGGRLSAWLSSRATPRTPVFVLANSETDSALIAALAPHDPDNGVMLIGVAARGFRPHLNVNTTPENERRAYDALAAGAPIATLLADNPHKVRNDEASLSRDRLAEASDAAKARKEPRPPADATLQRAVHMHRALRALKKI